MQVSVTVQKNLIVRIELQIFQEVGLNLIGVRTSCVDGVDTPSNNKMPFSKRIAVDANLEQGSQSALAERFSSFHQASIFMPKSWAPRQKVARPERTWMDGSSSAVRMAFRSSLLSRLSPGVAIVSGDLRQV